MAQYKPSKIKIEKNPPNLAKADFSKTIIESKKIYQTELKKLQEALLTIQQAYHHQKRRAIIIFQGWDAGGKGGSIRRLTERLDPRGFTVYPIGAPEPEEQGRHYLYRFFTKLPEPGRLSIFDRSYYERVLVERVENYASKEEWQRAYQEINEFERLLMDDDVRIVKIFLNIEKAEQLKRLTERLHNPMKHWKLTHDDIRNRLKWTAYEHAINDMFAETSTDRAPWHLISSNKKWYTRIEVLKIVAETLKKDVDITPPPLDRVLVESAEELLGLSID